MTTPIVAFSDYQEFASGANVEEARFNGAVAAIRRYCGWHVAPVMPETFTVDGSGSSLLQLRTLRLTDVSSVVNDGAALAATEFEWSTIGTLRRRNGVWTSRFRGVVVTTQHGFAVPPADLVSVLYDVTSRAVLAEPGSSLDKFGPFEFGRTEGGAVSFLPSERAVLDQYRLPVFA